MAFADHKATARPVGRPSMIGKYLAAMDAAEADDARALIASRFQPGDGLHVVEHVEILSGWAMHRGKEYRA